MRKKTHGVKGHVRDKRISIVLFDEELTMIQLLAAARGLTIGLYLRELIYKLYRRAIERGEVPSK